jgi:hypothetical protein
MGGDNFTKFKITEEIGKGNIKIIPDLIVSGNNSSSDGSLSGLMGLQLLNLLKENKINNHNDDSVKN